MNELLLGRKQIYLIMDEIDLDQIGLRKKRVCFTCEPLILFPDDSFFPSSFSQNHSLFNLICFFFSFDGFSLNFCLFSFNLGGWNHIEKKEHFDLHNVCLCFEVFKYYEPSPFSFPIGYVISKPITDKKSNAALKIIEISSTTASVLGGDKIILLCDKVKREDISVVFYENAKKQEIVWREEVNYKNSASMKVHHQYAISFQTPKYREFDIIEPKKVFIELYRPSDNERSEPISFELLPNNAHSMYQLLLHFTMNFFII